MGNGKKKLQDWKDLVQKTIKVKAKASLIPPSMLQKIDQQVARDKQFAAITKASIQEASIRNSRIQKRKF